MARPACISALAGASVQWPNNFLYVTLKLNLPTNITVINNSDGAKHAYATEPENGAMTGNYVDTPRL
jgi:hypothetical protein